MNSRTEKKQWIPAINGWKGILALFVVFLHFESNFFGTVVYFETGYLAVDCFFIISGFLLGKSLSEISSYELEPFQFVWRRMKKIYPTYIIGIILCIVYYVFLAKVPEAISRHALLGEILMLQMSGFFPTTSLNYPDWFLSPYLFSIFLISSFYKIAKQTFIYLVAPGIVVLVYSWLYSVGHLDIHYSAYVGVVAGGILRGLAGMSLGVICYEILYRCEEIIVNKSYKIWIGIIGEAVATIVTLDRMIMKTHGYMDFIVPFAFSIVVISGYSGVGIFSRILQTKLFQFYGNISLEIFLCHAFVMFTFCMYVPRNMTNKMVYFVAFLIIVTIFSYLVSVLVKKIDSYIHKCKSA